MHVDVYPGTNSSSPSNFRLHGGLLYFSANDTFGTELWRTDGSMGGTALVKDIYPGSSGGAPGALMSVGGYLYFAASHPTFGVELWRSDGTSMGTQLLSDINLGVSSSSPAQLTVVGTKLMFIATVTGIGTELLSYDIGSAPELALFEGVGTAGIERQDNVGAFDFGTQATPTLRSFTLSNTGSGYLYVTDIDVTGANAGSFAVGGKPDPSLPIQPGGTHTFTVTATLEGPLSQSAVLNVLCNDGDESSFDVPVTVTVSDTTPPVITAPSTYLIGQAGSLAMSLPDVRGIVAYTDNRSGDGTITQDPIPGDIVLAIGETAVVTFTAMDSAGNVSNTVTTTVQMGLGQPNTGSVAWARAMGAIGNEVTTTRVMGTADGGLIVAGTFGASSFVIGSGADQVSLTTAGGSDVFLAKFDRDGTLLWARSGGGASFETPSALMELPGGAVVLTGTFSSTVATFSGLTLSTAGGNDAFIARYEANGALTWLKGFGGTGIESITQMVALSDGNIAIAGASSSTATITVGPGVTLVNQGSLNTDLFLIKYQASDGLALWGRSLGSSGTAESSASLFIAATPDGGAALVVGMLSATMSFSGSAITVANAGAAGLADWLAAKYDSSGALQWARNVGSGVVTETPTGIRVFSNGDLAVAGTFGSLPSATFGVGSGSAQTFVPLGLNDGAVVRLSGGDGAQLWAKRFGGVGSDTVGGMIVLPDDSVAVTGTYANAAMRLGIGEARETTLTAPTPSSKMYVARLSGGDGSLRWAKTTGGLASNVVNGIVMLGGGDLGVAGSFQTPSEVFGPGEVNATTVTNLGASGDVFMAKLARTDGALVWAKSGGGANADSVLALTALPNGSAAVVGNFQPPSASFGAGEPGVVTLPNIESTGANTDLFIARFHGGGVDPPVAPLVNLMPASGLTASTLTFNASIDSRGQDTSVLVEYGPTLSYGSTAPLSMVLAGLVAETRSLSLSSLAPVSTLNFRVVATNAAGTTTSVNQVITTYPDVEIEVDGPLAPLVDGVSMVKFGPVALGVPQVLTFTVRNTAVAGTLSDLALSVDGAHAADYLPGTLGAVSLAPGGTTTFMVTFTPSVGGLRSAVLHVASNDGDEGSFDIALAGDNFVDVALGSAAIVPFTAAGYTVPTGRNLALSLGFEPAPGSTLTIVNNTSASPIVGVFNDLLDGGIVTATFGGQTYLFHANYAGGDGNDLVLTRAYDWTWMVGSNTSTPNATVGTTGVYAPANTPAGRSGAMSWTDAGGTVWMLGGSVSASSYLADLWKFDPAVAQWAYVKGSTTANVSGAYGTIGVAALSNFPGARQGGTTWIDSTGKLWLFGGIGYASSGSVGTLNDLWRFDPATNNWTWVKGSSLVTQNGTYGSQGVGAAGNQPGARQLATGWVDAANTLWLFGGTGLPASGASQGNLNDLWKFEPSTGNWTWMKGVNTLSAFGIYGTQGSEALANAPGARQGAASWIDDQGRFWLFGGLGNGSSVVGGALGDLWRYDSTTNMWTWIGGTAASTLGNGSYGRQGIPAATNIPGYRYFSSTWRDTRGRLWLHGGIGRAAATLTVAELSDLWVYDIGLNQWAWVKGPQSHQNNGIYGSLGTPAAPNLPGARQLAAAFATNHAVRDVWMMGGLSFPGSGTVMARMNDVWRLDLPNLPSATSLPATLVTATTATLNGSIIPDGLVANVRFRYGIAADLSAASVSAWLPAGGAATSISLPVTGLSPVTTYYFRSEVMNSAGSANGSILSFTTLAQPDLAIEQPVGVNLVDGVASVDIGATAPGTSVNKTFTLKNTAPVTLTITGATVDGSHGAEFVVGGLPATLAGSESTTFTVTFTPTALGARSAALHISSDDPDESPFDVALTGRGLNPFEAWAVGQSLPMTPGTDTDGDGIPNLMEYAFGLNPGVNDNNPIAANGSTRGMPLPIPPTAGTGYRAIFGRRTNHVAAGLVYTVQFSGDLTAWTTSTATPTVISDDGSLQAVTVPYPLFLPNGRKARFFRVTVDLAP
jgi:ELWxxDGT repeat protein